MKNSEIKSARMTAFGSGGVPARAAGIVMAGMLVAFVPLVSQSARADGRSQAVANFVRADESYKQGRYAEAITAYEGIISDGLTSGELYYNLGNSYFRNGDTGRAVLNYERAAQLIPRDRDLKFNRNYLFGRNADIQPHPPENALAWAMNKHLAFYTVDEMTLIVTALVMILGLISLAAFYRRWSRWTTVNASAVMLFLIVIYATGLGMKVQELKTAAVVIEATSANFEPRAEATEHFHVSEGARVRILKTDGEWVKVRRWDKKVGWVPASRVERVEHKS